VEYFEPSPYFKLIDYTSGEKLPKHIAFSETAITNSIPIKVSQKRYTFSPPVDVIKNLSLIGFRNIINPCLIKGFLTRQLNALLISHQTYIFV